MATSITTDFKIYNAEFQSGMWEAISQFTAAFNGSSRNAIRLVTQSLKGEYAKEAFFADISDMIVRRDVTSTSSAGGVKLTQDELISVKVNRRIGPVETTLDAVRKIASSQQEVSYLLGQMVGQKKTQDYLNTAIKGVEAALRGQSTCVYDATGQSTKTMITSHLVNGLAKMGDMSGRVVAWVMHSKCYFDLVGSQITDKITNVADRVIYGGSPGTLNRPVIISDIPALINEASGETTWYSVLGLVEDGVVVTESEQSDIVSEVVTGLANLVFRMQGEYAFNLGIKGFKWDTSNGGSNPTDASLATTTNWAVAYTDLKDRAGIAIKCN